MFLFVMRINKWLDIQTEPHFLSVILVLQHCSAEKNEAKYCEGEKVVFLFRYCSETSGY